MDNEPRSEFLQPPVKHVEALAGEPQPPSGRSWEGLRTELSTPKSALAFSAFFVLFPLWWILGLGQLGFMLLAIPLAAHLLKRRRINTPQGFSLWLLFLAVVLASVVTIWSWVPGLAPPGGAERILTYVFWLSWYVTATVFLLYIGNVDERELPTSRVVDCMACMFLLTAIGGYAGQFLWMVDFPSLIEMILPSSIANIGLVGNMIHPGLAQIQDIIGYEAPRPKAPWDYANSWGANYGILLPFFVLAFTGRRASKVRRAAFLPLLLLTLPPVLFSLNRGLWAGLVVMLCYFAIRLALQRHFLVLALLAGVTLAAGYLIVQTPLGDVLAARLDNPHSNQGRANLAGAAVTTTLENSPVIGLGTPRAMEGNFFSVAAGATDNCPKCSPPQLGTQGSAWFVIFTTGLLGATLFFAFLARRYFSGMRLQSGLAIGMTATGVFLGSVIWVYDIIGSSFVFVMIALALLWRAEGGRHEGARPQGEELSPRAG